MSRLSVFMTLFALLISPAVAAAVIRVPQHQPTIQAGIDAAVAGDIVLVADGTYTGPGNRDINFGGKAITVRSQYGPDNCIIDCQASISNPHRGFYFHNFEGNDSVVQGFTIRHGYSTELDGGGIYCGPFCSPMITGNIITMNEGEEGGGGIMCDTYSSPVIANNTITSNYGSIGGGGIACQNGASPLITDNVISNNNVIGDWGLGGGIYCWDASPTIIGNIISDNYTSGTLGTNGGGICLYSNSSPLISGNVITNNVSGYGGGMCCWNDGVFTPAPILENNLFAGNISRQGGGMYLRNNDAPTASIALTNNTFGGNMTTGGDQRGGGICCWFGYDLTITNAIFWGNTSPTGPQIAMSAMSITISYSDVEGGQGEVDQVGGTLTWGDGMLDTDPLFASGTPGDYCLSQVVAGQLEDSPCVDTGDPVAEMIWGTTRTDGHHDTGVVDMGGHYPWKSVSSALSCTPSSGVVPFTTQLGVQLTNNYTGFTRRIHARIDALTAGGMFISNMKSGSVNLAPGGSINPSFNQSIPATPTVIGTNLFTLVAEDVTPAPYNQPPNPPSGDTDTGTCGVTGIAP